MLFSFDSNRVQRYNNFSKKTSFCQKIKCGAAKTQNIMSLQHSNKNESYYLMLIFQEFRCPTANGDEINAIGQVGIIDLL